MFLLHKSFRHLEQIRCSTNFCVLWKVKMLAFRMLSEFSILSEDQIFSCALSAKWKNEGEHFLLNRILPWSGHLIKYSYRTEQFIQNPLIAWVFLIQPINSPVMFLLWCLKPRNTNNQKSPVLFINFVNLVK